MPQDVRNLVISGLISVFVGLAVYVLASSEASGLRSQITSLTAQVQALQATQASGEQRLADGDLQQKATLLRIDETIARLDAIDKKLAPPVPAPEPEAAPAAPDTPVTIPPPTPTAPAAGAPLPLVPTAPGR